MRSKPARRVMVSKRPFFSVSRLTVTRMRPADLSEAAWRARSSPFVVKARSSGPRPANFPTSDSIPLRTRGSPPVILKRRTPAARAARATVSISS
jgi:hypothetical protein